LDVDALDLLAKMLVSNPKKRITASVALDHPYLKSIIAEVSPEKNDSPCLTSSGSKNSSHLVYF
jgi:serine/threonine protein kinase